MELLFWQCMEPIYIAKILESPFSEEPQVLQIYLLATLGVVQV